MCSLNFSDHCCYCSVSIRNWQRTSFVVLNKTSYLRKILMMMKFPSFSTILTQIKVEDILVKLNVHKATGVDGISACILIVLHLVMIS